MTITTTLSSQTINGGHVESSLGKLQLNAASTSSANGPLEDKLKAAPKLVDPFNYVVSLPRQYSACIDDPNRVKPLATDLVQSTPTRIFYVIPL